MDALRHAGRVPKEAGAGWMCLCPAHGDEHASMSISVGSDGRVLVHCFAGCTPQRIVKSIGLSMRDLMRPNSTTHKNTVKKAATKNSRTGPHMPTVNLAALNDAFKTAITEEQVLGLAGALGVSAEALRDLDIGWCDGKGLKVLKAGGAGWEGAAYPAGALSFPERDGTGKIVGFSLRAQDGSKGAPRGDVGSRRGLIIPTSLLERVGPGARASIILIAEGASDVAAALTMGVMAVGRPSCNSGCDDLAVLLKDMEALTVGENDRKEGSDKWPGRDGAIAIAKGLAERLGENFGRWTMPPASVKDVRDWLWQRVAAGLDIDDVDASRAAGQEFVRTLITAAQHTSMTPLAGTCRYSATPDGLVFNKPVGEATVPVPLTNWTAQIKSDITEDDGVETRRVFRLEGAIAGREPAEFSVTAEEFAQMNWPIKHLGARAVTHPGMSSAAHARVAVQVLSNCDSRTVLGHTGWKKIGGAWVYLHAGGGIGATGSVGNVEVMLPGSLGNYLLPSPPGGIELVSAIRATLTLLTLADRRIMYPLVAAIFRAVLGDCDFSQFIVGPTGVYKTEVASLVQRHFGTAFIPRHLPGSWTSTENALEDLTFRAKDAILTIDDFKPSGSAGDDKLHQKADRVLRAQANGTGRQRLRSDCSLRPERPPRGMVISTGEDVPQGQSLKGRYLTHEISKGDISVERLTECQHLADQGLFAQTTSAYCKWLAPRLEEVHRELRQRVEALRREYGKLFDGSHARLPGMLANLHFGYELFLRFAVEATDGAAISDQQALDSLEDFSAGGRGCGAAQTAHQAATDPAQRFLQLLSSAIVAGKAHVCGGEGGAPVNANAWGWRDDSESGTVPRRPMGDRIGWLVEDNLYLDSNAAYRVAQAQIADGHRLAVAEPTLRKRLHEGHFLVSTELDGQRTYLIRTTLGGARQRVLHLRASDVVNTDPRDPAGDEESPL